MFGIMDERRDWMSEEVTANMRFTWNQVECAEDESLLIEKAKAGNRSALGTLFEQHYPKLYGYLLKLTGNEQLAQDLTQETVTKAVIHLHTFRGKSKFQTWLFAIASNVVKNSYRKKQPVFLDELYIEVGDEGIEDQVVQRTQLRRLKLLLDQEKEVDRQIFLLKYYEGFDYDEISQITGVKVGTCKSKMHYMIERLRITMEGHDV